MLYWMKQTKNAYALKSIQRSINPTANTPHHYQIRTLLPEPWTILKSNIPTYSCPDPPAFLSRLYNLAKFNGCRLMDWHALANMKPVRFHRSRATPVYSLSNMRTENISIQNYTFLFSFFFFANKNKNIYFCNWPFHFVFLFFLFYFFFKYNKLTSTQTQCPLDSNINDFLHKKLKAKSYDRISLFSAFVLHQTMRVIYVLKFARTKQKDRFNLVYKVTRRKISCLK